MKARLLPAAMRYVLRDILSPADSKQRWDRGYQMIFNPNWICRPGPCLLVSWPKAEPPWRQSR